MKNRFIYILILIFYTCSSSVIETSYSDVSIDYNVSLIDKVSQMIMIRMDGKYHNNESWSRKNIEDLIKRYNIGGLITFSGNIYGTYNNIKHYQNLSKFPMFVASDYERGLGVFIEGTLFPSNMAVAATQDTSYAYLQGKITAKEAKAIGVNMILAPVLDINNNIDNPIINFRSYGDNPQTVVKYGLPFIRGIQDEGLIACAKHYPGHGNTATDSHTSLPIINIDKNELYNNELNPFKKAAMNGVKSIMVGHIVIPQMDKENLPSTFSEKITKNILRDTWNYKGLIITDALEMGALTSTTWSGESAVKAVEAGADIILLPLNASIAINSIVEAVNNGRIPNERIDQSYERIIKIKKDMGLLDQNMLNWNNIEKTVGIYDHKKIANKIAEESMTLVKNNNNLIPFKPNKYNKVSHILLSTDNDLRIRLKSFARDVRYIHGNVSEVYVNDSLSSLAKQDIINKVRNSDMIIISMLIRISMDKGLSTIHSTHNELLIELGKLDIPMIGISFGSPYLPQYDILDSYLCTYGYGSVSLNASTDALFGRKNIIGKLPVTLNENYKIGHGIKVKKNEKIFESQLDINLPESFAVINKAIKDSIFPGAQLFVSKGENVLINKNFGNHTYDKNSKIVSDKSIYDVASLTKVLSTTPVVMKLIQKKMLSLDYPLSDFYDEFKSGNKKNITIRHLLTHTSGLPAYIEYYKRNDIESKDDIINDIIKLDLSYEPDSKMVYSDLGMILLADIVSKVTSSSLNKLSYNYYYKPLGMNNTFFNPKKTIKYNVVPTEYDSYFRNRLLQGEVHDETAFLLGGVSGHAGLFSNSNDIAKLAKLFLNKGVFNGRRYLKKNIVKSFTTQGNYPVKSDRILGWDTPSTNGKSSAGDFFSNQSYGHLGFTGTSLWIDPDNEIIIVLLTNRVHPTRDKKGIYKVRRDLHNSIMNNILEN